MTTQSEIKAILNRAADRLEKPGAWTQGAFGRDAEGLPVLSYGGKAVCWCALGSIFAEGGRASAATVLGQYLRGHGVILSAQEWNDDPSRTQAEVASLLRKAAEEA